VTKDFTRSVLVLSCFLVLPIKAAELWVAPDGNDGNPGTQAKPLASVASAQRQARRGGGEQKNRAASGAGKKSG
jgi:hypothetical protein